MIHTETGVTRHLESWAQAHLGNPDSAEYHHYIETFRDLLGAKRSEQAEAHDNKGLFGMSSVAGCMRNAALKRAGVKGVFTGSELATFELGHLCEVMTLALLMASGFEVETHAKCPACEGRGEGIDQGELLDCGKCGGTGQLGQIPTSLPPAHYSYADAILRGGPVKLPYPLVLSLKSGGYKSSGRAGKGWKRYGFAGLPLDGIHESNAGYWIQAQLEMAALDLEHTLVIVMAKDMIKAFEGDEIFQESGSLTWYAEVIQREKAAADVVAAAYARILESNPMSVPPVVVHPGPDRWFIHLPRPGDVASGWGGENKEVTGRFNPCFSCWYAAHCRGEVKP